MLTPRKIRENDNQLAVLIRLLHFINYTNEENYGRIKTDNVMKVVSCFEHVIQKEEIIYEECKAGMFREETGVGCCDEGPQT